MIHWNKEFTVYDTKPSLHLNTLAMTIPPLCFSASLSQIFWPIWEPASPSSVAWNRPKIWRKWNPQKDRILYRNDGYFQ